MRASDADRQRAMRRLSAGFAAGRLGADTFAHRIDLAQRAGSVADLHALTADVAGRARVALTRLRHALRRRSNLAARVEAASVWLTPPGPDEPARVIGRAPDCDLIVDDLTVSRRHAALRWTPEGYALTDLGSTNGCLANGVRVSTALVRPDDHIMLGGVRVRLSQHL